MIEIIYDHYLSKIEGMSYELWGQLRDILKYEKPYMNRKAIQDRTRFMPERWEYLINKEGFFYSGLLQDVISYFERSKIPFKLNLRFDLVEQSEEDIEFGFQRLDEMPVKPRPYQTEAILTAVDARRGVIVAGTGAGKGIILAGITTFLYEKTLILLDAVDIAEQLAKELYEYTGIPTGLIKGGRWETDKLVTVATIDTIHSKTKGKMKKDVREFIDSIQVLIIDECHHATAPSYEKFLEKSKAQYRFGLTATAMGNYYRGENGLTSNAPLLKGILGSCIWQKTSKNLIDEGWLSVPTIKLIHHNMDISDDEISNIYGDEERKWLIQNKDRNALAVQIIKEAISEDKNVIVFINRIEHGEILVEMMEEEGIDPSTIRYAYGEVQGSARQQMFKDFKSGVAKILIGTVLNEGLNFQIGVGINLGAGMTPRLAVQRLGRILRKLRGASGDVDTSTPTYTTYYDFFDKGHPIFVRHSRERKKIYVDQGHQVIEIKDMQIKKETIKHEDF